MKRHAIKVARGSGSLTPENQLLVDRYSAKGKVEAERIKANVARRRREAEGLEA